MFRGCKVQLTGIYAGGSCPFIVTVAGEEVRGEISPFLSRLAANPVEKWLCGL